MGCAEYQEYTLRIPIGIRKEAGRTTDAVVLVRVFGEGGARGGGGAAEGGACMLQKERKNTDITNTLSHTTSKVRT